MKLTPNPTISNVSADLLRLIGKMAQQVNAITEGRAAAVHNAATAAPVSGSWAVGDTIKNSAPAEAGSAGSKYVVTHFICVASGTPGTWVECRSLTGA